MSTWAIGDLQGCHGELLALLEGIAFDPRKDRLWLAGDLVNRGPDSLKTLRLVRGLGDAVQVVLGNHDLHLLATRWGGRKPSRKDTFEDILAAPDCDELCDWLRHQPLLRLDRARRAALVHAGLPPWWSTPEQALVHAEEVHRSLRGNDFGLLLGEMYGNEGTWSRDLEGIERLRVIINGLTRMRVCDAAGVLDLRFKRGLDEIPAGQSPWFEVSPPDHRSWRIFFGHWAALEMRTPADGHATALDSGCAWGVELTAIDVDSGRCRRVPAGARPNQADLGERLLERVPMAGSAA